MLNPVFIDTKLEKGTSREDHKIESFNHIINENYNDVFEPQPDKQKEDDLTFNKRRRLTTC